MIDETRYLYGVQYNWRGLCVGRLRIVGETPKTFIARVTTCHPNDKSTHRVRKAEMSHWSLGKLNTCLEAALLAARETTRKQIVNARDNLRDVEARGVEIHNLTPEQAMAMIEAEEKKHD